MTAAPGAAVRELSQFGLLLRRSGLPADTTRMIEFVRCAAELPADDLYWAGRVTLVCAPEQIPVYDRLFEEFFLGSSGEGAARERASEFRLHLGTRDDSTGGEDSSSGTVGDGRPSPIELVGHTSLVPCSPGETAEIERLTALLRNDPPARRGRRKVTTRRGALDLRETMRTAARTGGDPAVLRRRSPARRSVRTILVVDVSGSMRQYCRSGLLFAHAGIAAGLPWRAFCFGTRTTEVTDALGARTPDTALASVSATVGDLDGGTRIGEGLRRILDQPGPSPVHGALVIVVSDGLETGRATDLERQMKRLHSVARAVAWLNPLRSTEGYEPSAAGMQAALRWVSYFGEGQSLNAIAEQLPRLRRVAAAPHGRRVTPGGCSVVA